MKKCICSAALLLFCSLSVHAAVTGSLYPLDKPKRAFIGRIETLSQHKIHHIENSTMHPGCPITYKDLAYLHLSYWGFDNRPHVGEMVIKKSLAKQVVAIFRILYKARFPIQKMHLIDKYQGAERLLVTPTNTIGFNCRKRTGNSKKFSHHSYGRAIDINPMQNPFVYKQRVVPALARAYVKRSPVRKGMIVKGDVVYKAFISRGWKWGGNWKSMKDYMHFEKIRG